MKVLALLLALTLAGCGAHPAFSPMPPLPAAIAQDCPPLAQLADTSVATLAQADADTAILYAKCQEKHRAAVAAYNAARDAMAGKGKGKTK